MGGIYIRKSDGGLYEQLLSQYADDMSLFLVNETRIQPAITAIDGFSSVHGPILNLNKTEGVWLGRLKHRQNYQKCLNIMFPEEPIRSLGIYVGHDKTKCCEINLGKKLTLIKKTSDSLAMRNLTLIGKIYVIKSELLSKIIFCATILPISKGVVKQLNKIFYKFIWKSTEKLQRKIK